MIWNVWETEGWICRNELSNLKISRIDDCSGSAYIPHPTIEVMGTYYAMQQNGLGNRDLKSN